MTDGYGPALGETVAISRPGVSRSETGLVVGHDLSTNEARVKLPGGTWRVPWDRITPAIDAESRWRAHRDHLIRRGISPNGISKREFIAGLRAAA